MLCRDFSKATKRVIREASHADRSGSASFLGNLRHCCLGLCSSAKETKTGTRDHVSLCSCLTSLRRAQLSGNEVCNAEPPICIHQI